jgi:hypothetical protein
MVKLSNMWEHFPLIFSNMLEDDRRILTECFDLITGEMKKSPTLCIVDTIVDRFAASPLFSEEFTGYTPEERGELIATISSSADNRRSIEDKLLKVYNGWLKFNEVPDKKHGHVVEEYRALYSELLAAEAKADRLSKKFKNNGSSTKMAMDPNYRKWKTARAEIAAIERKRERLVYNTSEVTKLVRGLGVEAAKAMTTAVKGYHLIADGYRISGGYVGLFGFGGTEKYQQILNGLKELGYTITSVERPERGGSGMRASIHFDPFPYDTELKD